MPYQFDTPHFWSNTDLNLINGSFVKGTSSFFNRHPDRTVAELIALHQEYNELIEKMSEKITELQKPSFEEFLWADGAIRYLFYSVNYTARTRAFSVEDNSKIQNIIIPFGDMFNQRLDSLPVEVTYEITQKGCIFKATRDIHPGEEVAFTNF